MKKLDKAIIQRIKDLFVKLHTVMAKMANRTQKYIRDGTDYLPKDLLENKKEVTDTINSIETLLESLEDYQILKDGIKKTLKVVEDACTLFIAISYTLHLIRRSGNGYLFTDEGATLYEAARAPLYSVVEEVSKRILSMLKEDIISDLLATEEAVRLKDSINNVFEEFISKE